MLRFTNISDEDLEALSRDNPGWQLERNDCGTLILSPTSSEDGARSAEALVQLALWSRSGPGGKVFDSSTGFRLPDGSVLSPDAAWISPETLAKLPPAARRKFWPVAPDVVVELRSETDAWPDVQQKIRRYAANGAAYAIAIDRYRRDTFELGTAPHGLSFEIDAIIEA
jgi:Uma2 family endonuclease